MVMTRSYLAVFVVMAAIAWMLMLPSMAMAAPANDNFADAQTISGEAASVDGTNVGATTETGEEYLGYNKSVWYSWTAPEDGLLKLDTCASTFYTSLGVFTGSTLDSLTRVPSDGYLCHHGDRRYINVTAGTTYYIRVTGYSPPYEGNIILKLNFYPPPPNDDFADAQIISGQTASVDGTNLGATRESDEPERVAHYFTGHTVWYRWTAPFSGPVRIDTCTSDFDTILGVFTGSALGSLTERVSNYLPCGSQREVRFNATEKTTYQILVDSYYSAMGTFTLEVNLSHKIDCRRGQAVCAGTETSDRITGTRSEDNIQAGGGEDQIFALGANDVASGGAGHDVINGYDGLDKLYGGDGDDVIKTGGTDEDKDSVNCGPGWDTVWREKGKDTVATDCEKVIRYGSGGGGGY